MTVLSHKAVLKVGNTLVLSAVSAEALRRRLNKKEGDQ